MSMRHSRHLHRCHWLCACYISQRWIISSSFQHADTFHRRPSASERYAPPPPFQRGTASTASWASAPQFSVGEEVLVVADDGATRRSGVVERKKGGWYTVALRRDAARVKRRGSQLQKHAPPRAAAPEEAAAAPLADIVDLDFILQQFAQRNDSASDNMIYKNETIAADTIEQLAHCHSHYHRWLIFSDLHVMSSSLLTCLEVLETVHNTALKQNAGILFLGDFWHHRGFVKVKELNGVLEALSKWTVPCIMIPGNHDQIDWKGVEHALSPLSSSYRITSPSKAVGTGPAKQYAGPLILSKPTKFLNALFVPHTRDKATMHAILASREAAASSAMFVHADVKGASMNDFVQSQHGLPAALFPAGKHVYSGHFHKPHTTRAKKASSEEDGSSIRYVGSAYQTSFSEAGQAKSLLVVDAERDWQCVAQLPIDIGPRYHRVASVQQLLDSGGARFRRGDKVAVTACQQEIEELRIRAQVEDKSSSFDTRLAELRQAGIAVEIRDGQPRSPTGETVAASSNEGRQRELEDLSPEATLAAYLEHEVAHGDIGEATAKAMLKKGVGILREASDGPSLSLNSPPNEAELEMESVSVRGFGSFKREAVYPLRNRGVVLLRGTNRDVGSDSNGVGKSTLAMASLWALAGSVDPRPAQDGKVTDVVNDFSRVAEVTLRGSINSKPFIVTRTKGKASSLTFVLDGSDLTRQSSKDTQALINEHFNVDTKILMRTVFHGQHTIGGLLESSDAKLKEELSYLVSLDVWQQSASLARSQQRELTRTASQIEGMLAIRGTDEKRAEGKCHVAEKERKKREVMLEKERATVWEKEQQMSQTDSNATAIDKAMESVQIQLHDCDNEIDAFEEELSDHMDSGNSELSVLRSKLNEKAATENAGRANLQARQRKHDVATMELNSVQSRVCQLQSEWNLSTGVEHITTQSRSPETCRTCGQPITSPAAQKHVMENIEKQLKAEKVLSHEANAVASVASLAYAKAKEDAEARTLEAQACLKHLHRAEEKLRQNTDHLRSKIRRARFLHSNLSVEFSNLVRTAKEVSEFDLVKSHMQASLNSLTEALNSSDDVYKNCCAEVDMIKANVVALEQERETTAKATSFNALLADVFGPKGIQAFVLRNIVQALQYCSQAYLDELSDGSLQLQMQVGANDSIIKQAAVRNPDGTWRARPLSSLSGGQWRRCSLSLSLGFIDLASKRGKLRSSLLVLDEPLTHLDSVGRKSVGRLLRKMLSTDAGVGRVHGSTGFGLTTILVILQEIAAEEIEDCFDQIDEVVKSDGESFVILDKNGRE